MASRLNGLIGKNAGNPRGGESETMFHQNNCRECIHIAYNALAVCPAGRKALIWRAAESRGTPGTRCQEDAAAVPTSTHSTTQFFAHKMSF